VNVDLRLYLVTDPSFADLEAVVAAAVEGGVTFVQVRDKHASSAARIALVRSLRDVLPPAVTVVVNDDLEAARWCDGLHVGVDDVPPSAARAVLGPDAVIGWSINDLAQVGDDTQVKACTYVAVSPVWATATKPDASVPLGLAGVRAVTARVSGRMPVIGIGGIDAARAAEVVAAGADGVAVVSALCGAPDPRAAAERLRAVVDDALAVRGALR
jgi:thiamine-phosphate pyrophosphorylase